MIELIEETINRIDNLIKEQLPESKYQFELYDLTTNTKHFRGLDEHFHWGSIYKLFVVAEIIKMSEEGNFGLNEKIVLHKDKYLNGSGSLKFLTNLSELSYIDACKIVMATSDNLCADELQHIVGINRLNQLFIKAKCYSSSMNVNLDNMVGELFAGIDSSTTVKYFHSAEFTTYFKTALERLLVKNHTNVTDTNSCFHYILTEYLNKENLSHLKSCILMPNIHTRIAYYSHFGKYLLRGKSGMLGLGMVNNESVAIFSKPSQQLIGYFSINTKENEKRYFQANDTFGLIGLEIVSLYESLEEQVS